MYRVQGGHSLAMPSLAACTKAMPRRYRRRHQLDSEPWASQGGRVNMDESLEARVGTLRGFAGPGSIYE